MTEKKQPGGLSEETVRCHSSKANLLRGCNLPLCLGERRGRRRKSHIRPGRARRLLLHLFKEFFALPGSQKTVRFDAVLPGIEIVVAATQSIKSLMRAVFHNRAGLHH